MSTTLEPSYQPQPELSPQVRQQLAALRSRIRRYIQQLGIAATVVFAVALFWVVLAIDWWLEPTVEVRQGLLLAAAVVMGWVIWRWLIDRLSVPMPDDSMALLIERRNPQVRESLLTAVQLANRSTTLDPYGREMLAHTCEQAEQELSQVDLDRTLDYRPLQRWTTATVVACVLTLLAAILYPQMLAFGVQRLTLATNDPWPRSTRLVVEGFDGGEKVVAKGDNLEVRVGADTSMVIPATVQVRYRYADGTRGREPLIREGQAEPGRDAYQMFHHTFQSLPADVEFDLRGGDAVVRGLRIRVVDSPSMEMSLGCEYPSYMNRAPRHIPVTGVMGIERGTKVRVLGRANKDLVEARVDYPTGPDTFATETISLSPDSPREFEFTIDALLDDTTLGFTLLDSDGIRNREPIRLVLVAVADEPPQLAAQLTGIGRAITPQARLPFLGEITDDHGIDRVWLEATVDEQDPSEHALGIAPRGQVQTDVETAFEVSTLKLNPGQKLLVGLKASDYRSLPDEQGPNVGHGERYLLDIVTPDQLLAMLETQEMNLRQRFETIMTEVSDTRNSLARMEGEAFAASAPPAEGADSPGRTTIELPAEEEPESADRPVDPAEAARRLTERNRLRAERASQNSRKNAEETLGVATSFDAIREELINNQVDSSRIDTSELRTRLKDHIADPLRQIGGPMFERWQEQLAQLMRELQSGAGEAQLAATHREAIAQGDAILVAMAQVRDKMLELETFNEALELLRSIIASQQELNERTRQQRAQQLRRLLED